MYVTLYNFKNIVSGKVPVNDLQYYKYLYKKSVENSINKDIVVVTVVAYFLTYTVGKKT